MTKDQTVGVARIEHASRLVRWIIALSFLMIAVHQVYQFVTGGFVAPLWLLTSIVAMGLPAWVELLIPDYDPRSMVVWSSMMLSGSMMLTSIDMKSGWMAFFGACFAIAALLVAAFPIAPRKT